MNRIAEFERVGAEEFEKSFRKCFPEAAGADIRSSFLSVKLPVRATAGAAGYDFMSTADFTLESGEGITIPTGIRVRIDPGWALFLFPRSGLGFRYRLQLDNTVGIIDSDYYEAENEGHILVRLTNDSKEGKTLKINRGDRFCQGVFLPYGITADDCADGVRRGGFGSTG